MEAISQSTQRTGSSSGSVHLAKSGIVSLRLHAHHAERQGVSADELHVQAARGSPLVKIAL